MPWGKDITRLSVVQPPRPLGCWWHLMQRACRLQDMLRFRAASHRPLWISAGLAAHAHAFDLGRVPGCLRRLACNPWPLGAAWHPAAVSDKPERDCLQMQEDRATGRRVGQGAVTLNWGNATARHPWALRLTSSGPATHGKLQATTLIACPAPHASASTPLPVMSSLEYLCFCVVPDRNLACPRSNGCSRDTTAMRSTHVRLKRRSDLKRAHACWAGQTTRILPLGSCTIAYPVSGQPAELHGLHAIRHGLAG